MIITKDEDYIKYLQYLNKFNEFDMDENEYFTNFKCNHKYDEVIRKYKLNKLLNDDKFEYKMVKIARFVFLFIPFNKPLISNPCDYNGFELLEYCLLGYSLNCTGYSIVLNDLLLALNIKSRCVWGLSHIMGDDECHAFNHVYNEKEKKWIIVDPAFGCVPCNKDNTGLDIIEFRNAIANKDEIKLIKSSNIFHSASYLENYRRYLSKNLFMFLTLPNSGLEYFTQSGILIKPIDYTIDNCFYDDHNVTNNMFYLFN